MSFCIPKFAMNKVRDAIFKGDISTDELTNMSSADRRAFFEDIVGKEPAKELNANFESRLLLKNQKLAMERWINSFKDMKESVKTDMLKKVQKLSDPLSEKTQDRFLQDLVEKKLDIAPTIEEANELAKLANDVEVKRKEIKNDYNSDGELSDERLAFGRARSEFDSYVGDLKNPGNKLGLGGSLKEYFKGVKANPIKGLAKIGGITKSIKAGLDNSALLRQGFKTLITNPRQWATNARRSFQYMWDTFGGKDVMKEVKARMYADPDYDLAVKGRLAVGADDYIPTTLHEKIPWAGKLFAASDNAFSGFMYRTRFDVFKKYLDMARKAGVDVEDKEFLKSVGQMVNSQTGRGSLGKFEAAGDVMNNLFFSPRFIVSQFDTLLHPLTGAGGNAFVRKESAKSLAKILGAMGGIIAISNAINPGSAEVDPRSTDFGKIRFGQHRADFTGGLGSVITLISRLGTQQSKSGLTGKVTNLGERDKKGNLKFGARTGTDVLVDYMQNKLSPVGSVINDTIIRHSTFEGKKPTLAKELENLFVPLPLATGGKNINDPDTAAAIADQMLDFFGSSTTNYTNSQFKVKK